MKVRAPSSRGLALDGASVVCFQGEKTLGPLAKRLAAVEKSLAFAPAGRRNPICRSPSLTLHFLLPTCGLLPAKESRSPYKYIGDLFLNYTQHNECFKS
jgi:hypothetical protein